MERWLPEIVPAPLRTLRYTPGELVLVDQCALPSSMEEVRLTTADEVAQAIRDMVVRGAPAIGVAAAYGVALAARGAAAQGSDVDGVRAVVEQACAVLAQARPTAVNLSMAVRRMRRRTLDSALLAEASELVEALEREAAALEQFEVEASLAMGHHGAGLLPPAARVLVHCNAGALATVERGTALAVVYEAHSRGMLDHVIVAETRPRLQGARLTAFELCAAGVPHTLVIDSLAPTLMLHHAIDAVLVGADRIARSGDVANKVGTYALAVACAHHAIPLIVVAPTSTLDPSCRSGEDIPIEERPASEVLEIAGERIAPAQTRALNPAFDVTPAALITALVTERGVVAPVTAASMATLLERPRG